MIKTRNLTDKSAYSTYTETPASTSLACINLPSVLASSKRAFAHSSVAFAPRRSHLLIWERYTICTMHNCTCAHSLLSAAGDSLSDSDGKIIVGYIITFGNNPFFNCYMVWYLADILLTTTVQVPYAARWRYLTYRQHRCISFENTLEWALTLS